MAQPTSLIVDTDVGSDDLMAIAFLLSRPDVRIEALTVANGLCHVRSGANNLLRLLTLCDHPEIPVYVGRETPLKATAEFPAEWRRLADELPGVTLPTMKSRAQGVDAVTFLVQRLRQGPAAILTLGPLTNIASALERDRSISSNITRLVVMGGAFRAPGNLDDDGAFTTQKATAEWNMFVDPLAAQIVFRSVARFELISLDATAHVPIDLNFLNDFRASAKSRIERFIAQVLEGVRPQIERGYYQAWDPLAAVSVVDRSAVTWTPMSIDVAQEGVDIGRTVISGGHTNALVATSASSTAFRRLFFDLGRSRIDPASNGR